MKTPTSLYPLLLAFLLCSIVQAQPEPCGAIPTMAPNCASACVMCDIDGFTGTNNLQSNDQAFDIFCSFPNNVHYIAFIAGSSDLGIRIDLSNCTSGNSALDLGFYESLDCQDYTAITNCYDDLLGGQFTIFNATNLTVGQHYYLIMDGSNGAVCDWTFTVVNGSTLVNPLSSPEPIEVPELICEDQEFTVSNPTQLGASIFRWTLDGVLVAISPTFDLIINDPGDYQLCFSESNACDSAEEICEIITVQPRIQHDTTIVICEGDSVIYNNIVYQQAGIYSDILIPAEEGCDTIAQLNLDYGAVFEGDDEYFICEGDTLSINGTQLFEEGIYDFMLLTEKGCDSVVHTRLNLVICNMEGDIEPVDLLCFGDGNTGEFTFSITAGTPPFTYEWVKVFNENDVNGSGNLASDFEDVTISNVPAGSYIVTVSDNFNNFTIISTEVVEPPLLSSTMEASDYNGFNVSCFEGSDGTASVLSTGGSPTYAYTWSTGEQNVTEVSGLAAGLHTVTIEDINGCQHIDSIFLTHPAQLTFDLSPYNPDCEGPNTGNIEILNSGGGIPGYTYSFNGSSFSETVSYNNLSEGDYTIAIQDANGCIDSLSTTLIAAEIPELSFSDDITIDLGDTTILDPILNNVTLSGIVWTNAEYLDCPDCFNPFAFPVNTTTFNMQVTSQDGCIDDANIRIYVDKDRDIFAPNIFSPSASGEDALFNVLAGKQVAEILNLSVFDRWGNVLFSRSGLSHKTTKNGWDGTFNGAPVGPGVYVWIAEVRYLDDHVEKHGGDIMLVK